MVANTHRICSANIFMNVIFVTVIFKYLNSDTISNFALILLEGSVVTVETSLKLCVQNIIVIHVGSLQHYD